MEGAFSLKDVQQEHMPAIAGLPTSDDGRWAGILMLVASEYPYCTMHGVHVVEGGIVACEGIQRSFVFGPAEAATAEAGPSFDAHWQALRSLCARIGSGRLAEVRFSRGRPVIARVTEGGRRFRRLVAKASREGKGRSTMS